MRESEKKIRDKADKLLKQGEIAKAHSLLLPLAESGDVEAMIKLASSMHQDFQDLGEAEFWARRAIAAGGSEPYALGHATHVLALVFESRGDLHEAETWCRNSMSAGWSVAWISLQRILRLQGRISDAIALLQKVSDVGNLHGTLILGNLLFAQRNYAGAINCFRATLEGGFYTGQSLFQLGEIAAELGQTDLAMEYWNQGADEGHSGCQKALGG